VRNRRLDYVAANRLGYALLCEMFEAAPDATAEPGSPSEAALARLSQWASAARIPEP
jgi:hypothetical protein